MILDTIIKHPSGRIERISVNMPYLAVIKHLAIAGQDQLPSINKISKIIGMFLSNSDYLDPRILRLNHFGKPAVQYYDPTAKGDFSTLIGRAIADYLSKRFSGVKITSPYEAALVSQGIKIKNEERPDFYCVCYNGRHVAIEAKGFAKRYVSDNEMITHKDQADSSYLPKTAHVASVSYNLYNEVKVKYYDPSDSPDERNENLSLYLINRYYDGIKEYINNDIFEITEMEIGNVIYKKLDIKRLPKINITQECLKSAFQNTSILINKDIIKNPLKIIKTKNWFYTYNLKDELKNNEDNIYIDEDGIGLLKKDT